MKNKKLWISFAVIIPVLAALIIGLVLLLGGGTGAQSPATQPEVRVTLDQTKATVGVGGTLWLKAETENTTENVLWKSSDPDIASVRDGEVTALKEGTVIITASVGSAKAECTVVVSSDMPALTVNETYVVINIGSSYTLKAQVVLNGAAYTEKQVTYQWTASEGSDAFAALAPAGDGSTAMVTGVAYGNAEYIVTAEVNGVVLAKKVYVVCCDISVIMNAEGTGVRPDVGGFAVDLELGKTVTPAITVYSEDIKVENPQLSWSSDKPEIAPVSADGTITGLKEGTAIITVTYGDKNNHIRFFVSVQRPVYQMETHQTIETAVGTLTIADQLKGSVADVSLNGISVLGSISGNTITFKPSAMPTDAALMGEGNTLVIDTSRAQYVYPASVYSKVITTAEEFKNMPSYLTRAEGDNNWAKYTGYIVLGNDIDLEGASFELFTAESWDGGTRGDSNKSDVGFCGVLDGKGHSISNYVASAGNNGMFTSIGKSAVIKNLNIIDVVAPANAGTILISLLNGKLQDTYISIKEWDGGSLMNHPYRDGRFMENVVIEYTGARIDGLRDITGHWGEANYYPHYPTFVKNVFILGNITQIHTNCAEHGDTLPCGIQTFQTLAQLKAAGDDYADFSSDIWDISTGVPVPNKLFEQWSGSDVAITNPTAGGQYELIRGNFMDLTANVPYVTWELVGNTDSKVTLVGNRLTAQAGASAQQVTVKATNRYNNSRSVQITVKLVSSQNKTLTKLDYLELLDTGNQSFAYIDLDESRTVNAITSVNIKNNPAAAGSFGLDTGSGNRLKLGTEQLKQFCGQPVSLEIAYKSGEEYVLATCEVDMVITKALKTFADLQLLNSVATPNLDGYFILGADIDCENQNIAAGSTPGWANTGFQGMFDGKGYTISNLRLGDGASYSGIFGTVSGAVIQNVTFDNVVFANSRAGLLGRFLFNKAGTTQKTTIRNVTVNIAAWASGISEAAVFGYTSTANTVFENVTVNVADNVTVTNLLGNQLTTSNVGGDLTLNLGVESKLTAYYGTVTEKPDFVTVNQAVAEEIPDFVAAENTTSVTLNHAAFGIGEVSVRINGRTHPVTITEAGVLKLDLMDFAVTEMGRYVAVIGVGTSQYTFTDLWYVTQVIDTAAELKALGAVCKAANTTGFYILGADIGCSAEANMVAGNPGWETNGFSGTFDGRGKKISNIKLIWDNATGGYGGLFGNLDGCTIQNVVFDNVNYATVNVALLGRHAYKSGSKPNTVLENLTINISAWTATGEAGLLVSRSSRNTLFNNITVNVADNVTVHNLLGQAWNSNYGSGIRVNLGTGSRISAYYWTGTDAATAVTTPPTVVNIDAPPVEETLNSLILAEGSKTAVFSNASFISGNATVTINEQTKPVAITQNGKLTVDLANFGVTAMGQYSAVIEIGSDQYTYTDVWYVTKSIDTVAELKALGASCKTSNVTGFYILGTDIDCAAEANMAAGNPGWQLNGFSGTFDGRGKKISNIKMVYDNASQGYGGLFGNLDGCTIKNVVFDKVNYASVNVALLGRMSYKSGSKPNVVLENLTVNISAWAATGEAGVLVSRSTLNTLHNNITINVANGVTVHNLLGIGWNSNHGSGIQVNLGVGSAVTAYYWTDTNASTAVTTKPTVIK